ncbi:hypothetical protein CNN00215 [Cryptococcus deneoformans JEC21]|uniref:Cupin 2 conserved barrel domain-containing protein n=1 Tax=Cryptococcus deneoformans (strain JEC21 / ATCC MYA-565) TaxID=214684 RepID=A0A0S2M660_CRYD1|nr:hypothetical protein CNN00215 [Cryptococcus neoformans var. neoformans JEC21]ALO69794.1 hypothetical protein CNN00215 [Cryptococcus neoformans var. neoformans JEC21]
MTSSPPIDFGPHPLLKADYIDSNLSPQPHFLKSEAVRNQICMSDAVGMKSLAVHKVRLDPEVESCPNHYHLNESEWIYILSGSGILTLLDASPTLLGPSMVPFPATRSTSTQTVGNKGKMTLEKEEKHVNPGDFIGFEQGIKASRWSHSLRAGPQGIEYLMGGAKSGCGGGVNLCAYPEEGKTMVMEYPQGQEGDVVRGSVTEF